MNLIYFLQNYNIKFLKIIKEMRHQSQRFSKFNDDLNKLNIKSERQGHIQ